MFALLRHWDLCNREGLADDPHDFMLAIDHECGKGSFKAMMSLLEGLRKEER